MYEWVGYTWNPLAGECPHQCEYCYVPMVANRYPQLKDKYSGPIRIDEKALKQNLPKNKIIFVCSMNDLFADEVPYDVINTIIERTRELSEGRTFLFQSKNPARMEEYIGYFPKGSILATTIETNRDIIKTKAPKPVARYEAMVRIRSWLRRSGAIYKLMVNIEPIVDFDIETMIKWMRDINPDSISIGADSKNNNLPEPAPEKVQLLVDTLKHISEVRIKKNLNRLFGGDGDGK